MSFEEFQACSGLAWRTVEENTFVYGSNGRLHILEGTVAAHLWAELDQSPKSIDDLVATVVSKFTVEEPSAREDVIAFLNRLVRDKLVQPPA
jgi:hypothetical protein